MNYIKSIFASLFDWAFFLIVVVGFATASIYHFTRPNCSMDWDCWTTAWCCLIPPVLIALPTYIHHYIKWKEINKK